MTPTSFIQLLIDCAKYLVTYRPGLVMLIGGAVFARVLVAVFKPRIKGFMGEAFVNIGALHRLNPSKYQVFKDLYLPRPDGLGTTQTDHVVVSPYGIFVIETKNMSGWVFGSEDDRKWTQSFPSGRKVQFLNPLHQNELHIQALSAFLSLPREVFHSMVFFTGKAEMKTAMPASVLTTGFKSSIEAHAEEVLSNEEARLACHQLIILTSTTKKFRARREQLEALASRRTA